MLSKKEQSLWTPKVGDRIVSLTYHCSGVIKAIRPNNRIVWRPDDPIKFPGFGDTWSSSKEALRPEINKDREDRALALLQGFVAGHSWIARTHGPARCALCGGMTNPVYGRMLIDPESHSEKCFVRQALDLLAAQPKPESWVAEMVTDERKQPPGDPRNEIDGRQSKPEPADEAERLREMYEHLKSEHEEYQRVAAEHMEGMQVEETRLRGRVAELEKDQTHRRELARKHMERIAELETELEQWTQARH